MTEAKHKKPAETCSCPLHGSVTKKIETSLKRDGLMFCRTTDEIFSALKVALTRLLNSWCSFEESVLGLAVGCLPLPFDFFLEEFGLGTGFVRPSSVRKE